MSVRPNQPRMKTQGALEELLCDHSRMTQETCQSQHWQKKTGDTTGKVSNNIKRTGSSPSPPQPSKVAPKEQCSAVTLNHESAAPIHGVS